MYSVLLSAMVSYGTTAPEFGRRFDYGCWGCHGCVGCMGCVGCYGCYGCDGCRGGFLGFGRFSSRYSGCYGCAGCCGGCFGGCFGCYGAPMMAWSAAIAPPGLPIDAAALAMIGPSLPMIPGETVTQPPPGLGETLTPAEPPAAGLGESVTPSTQATVVVTLPADAKLFADGTLIDQSGPVRTFRTPPLEVGRSYYYVLSIEVQRSGQNLRKEERVNLEAGKVTRVNFTEPAPGTGNTARGEARRTPDGLLAWDPQAWNSVIAKPVLMGW